MDYFTSGTNLLKLKHEIRQDARALYARCKLLLAIGHLEEEASNATKNEGRQAKAACSEQSLDKLILNILKDVKSSNNVPDELQSWFEQTKEDCKKYTGKDKGGQRAKKHLNDVMLFYDAWGENAALILSRVQQIDLYYVHARTRLALLSAILRTDACTEQNTCSTPRGNAPPVIKHVPGDPENCRPRKRQCKGTADDSASPTTRTSEADTSYFGGQNFDHTVAFIPSGANSRDSTSEILNTELYSFRPLQGLFQWQIPNSADVLKMYGWGTLQAMKIMLPKHSAEVTDRPMYSDEKYDYYAPEKASISRLPDPSLVEAIKRSKQWQEEMQEEITGHAVKTKCLTIALVKGNLTPTCIVCAITDSH
ncbi:hypothetical protein BS50DRAFT_593422 [Corynespora cassiicola Philippines]|uniref:Uncharacterized protein n=1 Tax=Corynespora cassiicola Philippines TaxID=1448308 RepID=A0A2T2N6P7_CORCC|nr:hypothetical protein BS50DRAFT_593422 [Corynespora cassiicola Philippines]